MLRFIFALMACLVALAEATAAPRPPARYDHPHPDMLIIERSLGEVDRICRAIGARTHGPNSKILGCAPVGKTRCAIVVPKRHPQKAEIIRHERAHCNGWPANHSHGLASNG